MSEDTADDVIAACRVLIRQLRAKSSLPSAEMATVARHLGEHSAAAFYMGRRRSGFYLDPAIREDTIRQLADLQEDLELELAAQRRHGVKPQPRRTATSEQGKERR